MEIKEVLDKLSDSELKDLVELKNSPGYKTLLKVRSSLKAFMGDLALENVTYDTAQLFVSAERKGTLIGWKADAGMIKQAEDRLEEQKSGKKRIVGGVKVEDLLRYGRIDTQ